MTAKTSPRQPARGTQRRLDAMASAGSDELEQRVTERTAELAEANAALSHEVVAREQSELRVRDLLGQLVQAVEAERGRISRELHDSLGQHLTALALGLKSIADTPGCPPDVAQRLSTVQQSVQRLEDEVDRLAHRLRPPALDELGLDDALRSHAEAWAIESGLQMEMHIQALRLGRLPPAVETTIYRVAQEALNNIRKHAGVARVGLFVERRADEVRLIVEDDGCGFDTGAVATTGKRLGLRGMAERAALVGGRLEIESAPGAGTAIYLAIPVHASGEHRAGPGGVTVEPPAPAWRTAR
jgi:signal transduction histidine kinase